MKKIVCIKIFFCLLYCSQACAQNTLNGISLSVVYGPKVFAPTAIPLNGGFETVEAGYLISTGNYNADWVRTLHVVDVKIAASYTNMTNVLLQGMHGSQYSIGNSGGITGSLDIQAAHIGNTNFILSPGFGFNYFAQDFYTNYQPVVGSHLNFVEQCSLQIQTPLSQTTTLGFGIHARHISNGDSSMPNVGLNPVGAMVSITHAIGTQGPGYPPITYEDTQDGARHHLELSVVYGGHGLVQTGYYTALGGRYVEDTVAQRHASTDLHHFGVSMAYNYNLNSVLSVKAGTDVVYYTQTFSNSSLANFLNTYEDKFTSYDKLSVGLSVGMNVWLGNLSVNGSYGYYVHYKSYYKEPTYWIVGASYSMTPYLALTAKMHMQGIDPNFIGVGLTTSFL